MLKDLSVSSSDCDNRKSAAVGPAGLIGVLDTPILESAIRPSLSTAEALQRTVIYNAKTYLEWLSEPL